jgi:hypothetical protein
MGDSRMKKILPLLMLIGIVLFSGCVGQTTTTTTGTNGLIISDFSFSPTSILPGETTELYLDAQNVGGETAYLKKVTVFGVDSISGAANALQWGLPTGENFIEDKTSNPDDLIPPDPSTGFEGDFSDFTWHPQAPTGVKAETNYDFEVRVEYGYSTTYTGFIRLMEDSYLNTLPRDQRENLQKVGGVVNPSVTGGPLTVAAASGRHFVIRSGDVGGDRTIKFKVTNVGSGSPYGNSISTDLYKISVTGTNLNCDLSMTLSRGKTGIISCTFNSPAATDPSIAGKNKIDKAFSIKLDYNYFVDSTATITVKPGF